MYQIPTTLKSVPPVPSPVHMNDQTSERYVVAIEAADGLRYRRLPQGGAQNDFWDYEVKRGVTAIYDSFMQAYEFRNELIRTAFFRPEYATARVVSCSLSNLYPNA